MSIRIVILLIFISIVSCNKSKSDWENLIIDNSLKGWHIFQNDGTKSGWSVEDNIFIFDAELSEKNMLISDASLLSDKKYLNFEIKFDWKIERGGNSGFMWSVDEDLKYKFPYQTGPEIQIIDTETYLSPESIKGGEIEINNILINEFPLSGKTWDSLVNQSKFSRSEDYEYLGDERWFGFSKNKLGHICLQDHPGKAFFKNIFIRELN